MAANIQDRLTHASEVTKWKVDQQSRILKAQNKITDFERQIGKQKAFLANRVYDLFAENKIKNPEVTPICDEIAQLFKAIEDTKIELENIRNEQPPELQESHNIKNIHSGLVCPVCGKELSGKFCPNDGAEGVEPDAGETHSESGLVCPVCGKPVPVKFCMNCGVEGIPEKKKEEKPKTVEKSKEEKPKSTEEKKEEK